MGKISFILNLPYTFFGLLTALISIPSGIAINRSPFALIIKVKKLQWIIWWMKNIKGVTMGNVILLNKISDGVLSHELVHIKQFQKYPLVFPVMYYFDMGRRGYRNNKYEMEAYSVAKNMYKEK